MHNRHVHAPWRTLPATCAPGSLRTAAASSALLPPLPPATRHASQSHPCLLPNHRPAISTLSLPAACPGVTAFTQAMHALHAHLPVDLIAGRWLISSPHYLPPPSPSLDGMMMPSPLTSTILAIHDDAGPGLSTRPRCAALGRGGGLCGAAMPYLLLIFSLRHTALLLQSLWLRSVGVLGHPGGAASRPKSAPGAHAGPPRSTGPTSASSSHSSVNHTPAGAPSPKSALPTSTPATLSRAPTAPSSANSHAAPHSAIPGPPGGPSSRYAVFDAALAASSARGRTPQPTSTVPLRHVQRISHARAVSLGRPSSRDASGPGPDDCGAPSGDNRGGRPSGSGGPTMPEEHAVRFSDESGSVTIRGGRIAGGSYMADSSLAELHSPSDSAISFGQAARDMGGPSVLAGLRLGPADGADVPVPARPPSPPPGMTVRETLSAHPQNSVLRPDPPAADPALVLVLAPTAPPPSPPAAQAAAHKPRATSSPPRGGAGLSPLARGARGSPGAGTAERQGARRPPTQKPATAPRTAIAARGLSRGSSRLDQLWSRGSSTPTRRASTGYSRSSSSASRHPVVLMHGCCMYMCL